MTGREYMGRVAALGCVLCRRLGLFPAAAEVHHRRSGTGRGRADDFDTMPLCYPHHRDHPGAFHVLGTKGFVKTYGLTEADLIADTRAQLGVTEAQIEVWREAVRDRRREVPKPARGPKAPGAARARTKWPSRKLASRSSFRPRPARED